MSAIAEAAPVTAAPAWLQILLGGLTALGLIAAAVLPVILTRRRAATDPDPGGPETAVPPSPSIMTAAKQAVEPLNVAINDLITRSRRLERQLNAAQVRSTQDALTIDRLQRELGDVKRDLGHVTEDRDTAYVEVRRLRERIRQLEDDVQGRVP